MDERSEARYLAIVAGALLLAGVWLGWASHLIWVDRYALAHGSTGLQVAGHALRGLLPFGLLAAALWVLPRRRNVAATLCLTLTVMVAMSAFGLRSTLRSAGRDWPGPLLGAWQETWQWWSAVLGAFVAATISRWQSADVRRP